MCPQLCPGHIDPGWPQISEGLRRLPVSKEDFVEAGEAAGIISAKEQILIFGPHELRDCVAVAVKPFDAPHPSRVRQIESVPGVSADFGVGSAKGEKSDRMPFVPKYNSLGTGQVYVRIALEEFDLALEPGGVGDVVLIHSREVLSSREVYPLVESGRQAQVPSILDDSDSVVRSFEPCHAVVRRAIVDENQFPFTERLEPNGGKRLRQSLPGVVHGQNDADEWNGSHWCRRTDPRPISRAGEEIPRLLDPRFERYPRRPAGDLPQPRAVENVHGHVEFAPLIDTQLDAASVGGRKRFNGSQHVQIGFSDAGSDVVTAPGLAVLQGGGDPPRDIRDVNVISDGSFMSVNSHLAIAQDASDRGGDEPLSHSGYLPGSERISGPDDDHRQPGQPVKHQAVFLYRQLRDAVRGDRVGRMPFVDRE